MITPLLKYLLVAPSSELQVLILVTLILSERSPRFLNSDQTIAVLFITQATCIDIVGLMSVLTGVSLPWVVLMMTAQGVHLIIDAHRTLQKGE